MQHLRPQPGMACSIVDSRGSRPATVHAVTGNRHTIVRLDRIVTKDGRRRAQPDPIGLVRVFTLRHNGHWLQFPTRDDPARLFLGQRKLYSVTP